jgi:hypothetical protein
MEPEDLCPLDAGEYSLFKGYLRFCTCGHRFRFFDFSMNLGIRVCRECTRPLYNPNDFRLILIRYPILA